MLCGRAWDQDMNRLEKSIYELINMLVQYEATTKNSPPSMLVGEAVTSKPKGKGARRWKRKKGKVLERSRNLGRNKMVPKLSDGKVVVAEAIRIVHLVHDLIRTAQNKRKMTKKPFIEQSALANDLLDLIHSDVCRPLNTQPRGGFSYFITFIDDHSWEYALETAAKLLNMVPSKTVTYTSYQIWHGKLLYYKYLKVLGIPTYFKRLVGDKLDSSSSLCRFVGYPKETIGSTIVPQQPERYGFLCLTSQLDNNPKTYGEAMLDIDSEIRNLGEASYILAIKIIRDRSKRILGMTQTSQHTVYVVQCIRPDVTFTLSVTSRYQACADETHWIAVKTILKYLRRNKDIFLIYGFVLKLNGGVVAWKSFKQDITVYSTTEANYVVALQAVRRQFG
ncbi:hypothetical protein Sango_0015700 [Sesamum angolense]|uniref:Reverse transcriptase Ty1/copia-type domain-containing protein n=1 Tax=Sesamum angolense TaxID=2727404 RepID=A0AAE2C524_9LAMI|nr:hypothetical protein Sango_0015700 [Sesamum angolense]